MTVVSLINSIVGFLAENWFFALISLGLALYSEYKGWSLTKLFVVAALIGVGLAVFSHTKL
jgi:hypothetical protein